MSLVDQAGVCPGNCPECYAFALVPPSGVAFGALSVTLPCGSVTVRHVALCVVLLASIQITTHRACA